MLSDKRLWAWTKRHHSQCTTRRPQLFSAYLTLNTNNFEQITLLDLLLTYHVAVGGYTS